MENKYVEDDFISQFNFRILIKNADLKGSQIKSQLLDRRPFSDFYYNEKYLLGNPIYEFINHSFKRHFKFIGNNKAYLADYQEKEGSLEITFAIILICGYGGIRETVDYFTEDLETLFHLENNFDISINYNEKKSKRMKKNSVQNIQIIGLERKLKTLKILLSFSFFLSIVLGMYTLYLNEKITDLNVISKMIDEKIGTNNSEVKLDYLFKKEIRENTNHR